MGLAPCAYGAGVAEVGSVPSLWVPSLWAMGTYSTGTQEEMGAWMPSLGNLTQRHACTPSLQGGKDAGSLNGNASRCPGWAATKTEALAACELACIQPAAPLP